MLTGRPFGEASSRAMELSGTAISIPEAFRILDVGIEKTFPKSTAACCARVLFYERGHLWASGAEK